MPELFAYTDGACSGNPGPGGWGVLMLARENGTVIKERELMGGEALTTNNRMELTAVIQGLQALKKPSHVRVYTDSSYVQKGMTEWLAGWKLKQWRTADKKPVKNDDLWRILDGLAQQHTVQWIWVKGHAGNVGNERADSLANKGMEQVLQGAAS